MSDEKITLDASSTIDQLQKIGAASAALHEVGDAKFLVLPDGFKQIDITSTVAKLMPYPSRKQGVTVLLDIDSFVSYCFHEESVRVYADPNSYALTAVFNDNTTDRPGWRDHRAVYCTEKSSELVCWLKNNKQPMEQEAFAVFLEDNISDIVEPSGEQMLAMALTMQAKTEANFQSSRRLDNGQVQLIYTETIDARAGAGQIEIPREFSIGIRLFKNGSGYKLRARLKYRLGGGRVKFWYELDRPETSIEEAFAEYVAKVVDSGYTVFIGNP